MISVAASAAAFTLVVRQTWGESSRLGGAVLRRRRRGLARHGRLPVRPRARLRPDGPGRDRAAHDRARSRVLALLTFAASPLAFLFLLVVLAAAGVARTRREIVKPAIVSAAICAFAARALCGSSPTRGTTRSRRPSLPRRSPSARSAWRSPGGSSARASCNVLFIAYGARLHRLVRRSRRTSAGTSCACGSPRVPIAILVCSLRRWRPLPLAVLALALAAIVERLAARSTASPAARTTRRQRARTGRRRSHFLHQSLSPDYRVEAVGTADHWEAVYLPQAAIPIVRGWFRQDDFPQNEVLYDKLTPQLVPGLAAAI